MDPISFTIGVVSIASVFQTCLHGYRSLNEAMEIGNTALTLNIQFRVEELRLYLWGRNWGLVQELDKNEMQKAVDIGIVPEKAGKPVSILDSVDDELEIPGLRDLTIEVLGRIQKALEEWRSVGERYGAAPGEKDKALVSVQGSKRSSNDILSTVGSKQRSQAREISDRNRIAAKLRWALNDKTRLEGVLAKLTNFNDSLEKLLPRRERASLARGLAGEILNILERGKINDSESDIDEQLEQLRGLDELKAAQIVRLKRANQTEKSERRPDAKKELNDEDQPTPFSKPSVWATGPPGAMEIPPEHFLRLTEPKMKYYEVYDHRTKWFSAKYVPLPRSAALYAPTSRVASSEPDTIASLIPSSEESAKAVLVEWRPLAHESNASELTAKDLKDRRDHIARLLHRTSVTDTDFRVLDCLGYTATSGHTPDGSAHELVGYVYRYPNFASPKSLPVSLRDLLGQAYDSDDPKVPSLDERFKLARNLAIALYQLQCAGWVHRKISSYNVIFFRNRANDELDLSQPFLMGWQYSRPDDQRRLYPSERHSSGIGDLDMYVHRDRTINSFLAGKFPRFRKSYDIYSLGIILIEIAFWEPIMALASEEQRMIMVTYGDVENEYSAEKWWETILKTAKGEIAPEMGVAYRDAVLFCLQGDGFEWKRSDDSEGMDWQRRREDPYYVETDFEEVGIEKEFYWRVLKALETFQT
jgi:hypothetical protein